ncbi:RND family transporter [Planctomycetota bacterium]
MRQCQCRESIAKLQLPPFGLSRSEAISRLQGTLVGPDNVTTCLVVTFTKEGLERRAELVVWLREAARIHCHVEPADLHLAGPVMDGLTVDTLSKHALNRFAIPSTLIVFYVCYLCLGSLRGGLLVVGLSLLGQGATLALVHYAGDEMSALLIVMPPLIQVLAVAGGIHLVNYYAEARTHFGKDEAAARALQMGWLPCALSAGTTALGLVSLTTSGLTPIRSFGVYSSAGVLVTTGLLLAFIPGTLVVWPFPISGSGNADASFRVDRPRKENDMWGRLALWLSGTHGPVTTVCLVTMLVTGWGVSRISTSVRIETLFSSNSRILNDYRWIEQNIGPCVPVEVMLNFDVDSELSFRERLDLVWRVEQALQQIETISSTNSALTFAPKFVARPDLSPEVYQQHFDQALTNRRAVFKSMNYLTAVDDAELFRVTANMSALDDIDYGYVLDDLRAAIAPVLLDSNGRPLIGVTSSFTGIMPLVHEIQRQLLADLLTSFLTAVFTITLVLSLVHGSIAAGIVTMISNVFPILFMFGGLAWLEIPMDIGSVMTASVALGIAVDDTLHFLTFYRRGLGRGMSRQSGVIFAYRHCGRAMIQTSLACGLGLLVFALSDFVPTSRFACMMFAMLATALFADLILLPALLLGPLGTVFTEGPQKSISDSEEQVVELESVTP